jgi:hypothetical protein
MAAGVRQVKAAAALSVLTLYFASVLAIVWQSHWQQPQRHPSRCVQNSTAELSCAAGISLSTDLRQLFLAAGLPVARWLWQRWQRSSD